MRKWRLRSTLTATERLPRGSKTPSSTFSAVIKSRPILRLRKYILLSALSAFFLGGVQHSYSQNIQEPSSVRVPPLFWYEYDPEAQRKFLMACLLYWSGKDNIGAFQLLAPLYYNSTTEKEQVRIMLPLYLRLHTSDYDSRVVFPLYWSLHSMTEQKSYQTFIPFYFKMRDDKVRTRIAVSPFFFAYQDQNVSRGFFPPYGWSHSAGKKTEVGFPLYWRFYRENEGGGFKDIRVFAPYFSVDTENGGFRGMFPLYVGRTKKDLRWDLFLPLFLSSEKKDGSKKIVTPLFTRFHDADGTEYGHSGLNFYRQDTWGGRTEGLIPFFYYREEPDFYKFRFLNLYLERHKSKEHTQTSFFPLFRYRRDSDRRQILTPLVYFDRDPDTSRGFILNYVWHTERQPGDPAGTLLSKSRFVLPLYWHFLSENQETTVITPVFAFQKRPDVRFSMIAPFYFSREKENDVSWAGPFFLFWHRTKDNKSTFTAFPFYRSSRYPEGHSLFLPGFYYIQESSGTEGMVAPYLWRHRGETHYEIFPPLYVRFERPAWNIRTLALSYRFENKEIIENGIFPLWAKTVSNGPPQPGVPKNFLADSERLLPFYFYRKLDNGYDLMLPIVLGRFEKWHNPAGQEFTRGRLFLLQYWEKSPGHYSNRLDPLYTYTNDEQRKGFEVPTAPFPLWQYEREGALSNEDRVIRGAFFPYYWKESKVQRRDLFFPLYYRNIRRPNRTGEEIAGTTWLLNYFSKRNAETSEKIEFLAPFYWRFEDKTAVRTLIPPVWTVKGASISQQVIFPLWWSSQSEGKTLEALFPFYLKSEDQKANQKTLFSLPFFYSSSSPEKTILSAFPVFWKWSWNKGARSASFFFPIYFSHHREDLDWVVFQPLYWKFRTGDTLIRVIPPYFSVVNQTTGSKTIGFAPLWSFTRNPAEDSSNFQILGGLFGINRTGNQKHITLLYIINIKREEEDR